MFGISDHDLMFTQEAQKEVEEPEEQQFIQQKVRLLVMTFPPTTELRFEINDDPQFI